MGLNLTPWVKRSRALNEKKRIISSHYLIEQIAESKRSFVFGLNWFVVLGENLDKEAYKLARKYGADFYIRGGSQSNLVGLLKTNKENGYPKRDHETHSISLVFAKAMPNAIFAVRFNTPKGVWFMVSNKGVVQEDTDCFFDDYEHTENLINSLKKRWPEIQVFGDIEGDSPVPDLALLLSKVNSYSKIKRTIITFRSIPKWVWVFMFFILMYFLANESLDKWNVYKKEQAHIAQRIELRDPEKEWQEAIRGWSEKTYVLGEQGLASWTHSIAGIPVFVGKWKLENIKCSELGSCSGSYIRMRLGTLDSFERYVPRNWNYKLIGLDKIKTSFDLPIKLQTVSDIKLTSLPKLEKSKKDEINRLQKFMPVIESIDLKEVSRVDITSPNQEKYDGSFDPIPFPINSKEIIYPLSSKFSFLMPLRSLLSLGISKNYAINSIDISLSDGSSNRNSSWLSLIIEGEYYVQK